MTMGRKRIEHAINIWRECMANNEWPMYPAEIVALEYPAWQERQWLEREVAEAERQQPFDDNILIAG
jgi:hypothetical protein